MTIKLYLREYLDKKQIRRDTLSRKTRIRIDTILKLCEGDLEAVTLADIEKIARTLNVPTARILRDDGDPAPKRGEPRPLTPYQKEKKLQDHIATRTQQILRAHEKQAKRSSHYGEDYYMDNWPYRVILADGTEVDVHIQVHDAWRAEYPYSKAERPDLYRDNAVALQRAYELGYIDPDWSPEYLASRLAYYDQDWQIPPDEPKRREIETAFRATYPRLGHLLTIGVENQ